MESGLGACEVPKECAAGHSVESTVWGGGAESRLESDPPDLGSSPFPGAEQLR